MFLIYLCSSCQKIRRFSVHPVQPGAFVSLSCVKSVKNENVSPSNSKVVECLATGCPNKHNLPEQSVFANCVVVVQAVCRINIYILQLGAWFCGVQIVFDCVVNGSTVSDEEDRRASLSLLEGRAVSSSRQQTSTNKPTPCEVMERSCFRSKEADRRVLHWGVREKDMVVFLNIVNFINKHVLKYSTTVTSVGCLSKKKQNYTFIIF